MCTNGNRVIMESVIEELAQRNQLFTAYDVTSLAKERGADENHYQLKTALGDFFSTLQIDWGYDRTLITIPINGDPSDPQAFVYYPDGADPYDYDHNWREPDDGKMVAVAGPVTKGPLTPPLAVGVTNSSSDNDTDSSDDDVKVIVTTDKRGRLNLTSAMVKRLGVKEGDEVLLYSGLNALWAYGTERAGAVVCKTYIVDGDNSVRVGGHVLAEASLSGDQFEVSYQPSTKSLKITQEG